MAGTLGWVAILVAGVALEATCRISRSGHPTLGRVLGHLQRRPPGRLLLLAAWAFAGLHLFARYTVLR